MRVSFCFERPFLVYAAHPKQSVCVPGAPQTMFLFIPRVSQGLVVPGTVHKAPKLEGSDTSPLQHTWPGCAATASRRTHMVNPTSVKGAQRFARPAPGGRSSATDARWGQFWKRGPRNNALTQGQSERWTCGSLAVGHRRASLSQVDGEPDDERRDVHVCPGLR